MTLPASGFQPVPEIGASASALGTYRGHSTGTACLEAQPVSASSIPSSSPRVHVSGLRMGNLRFELAVAGVGRRGHSLDLRPLDLRSVRGLRVADAVAGGQRCGESGPAVGDGDQRSGLPLRSRMVRADSSPGKTWTLDNCMYNSPHERDNTLEASSAHAF